MSTASTRPPASQPPSMPPELPRAQAQGRRGARRWASALLLLGAGLAMGALYLPWKHTDAQTTIPLVTFGLGNVPVSTLLGCALVAFAAGLVALILPPHALGWLATLPALAGPSGLVLAFAVATFGFTYQEVNNVIDSGYYLYSLGCALIIVGTFALFAAVSRGGRHHA